MKGIQKDLKQIRRRIQQKEGGARKRGDRSPWLQGTHHLLAETCLSKSLQDNLSSSKCSTHGGLRDPEEKPLALPGKEEERLCVGDR